MAQAKGKFTLITDVQVRIYRNAIDRLMMASISYTAEEVDECEIGEVLDGDDLNLFCDGNFVPPALHYRLETITVLQLSGEKVRVTERWAVVDSHADEYPITEAPKITKKPKAIVDERKPRNFEINL